MSHHFLPSIKKGVSYCTVCGCLSYKNILSKNIFSHSNNPNKFNIDPLIVKYNPISLNLDISLKSHETYLKFRQKGISKIYFLSNKFELGEYIISKSIGLMDQIYLKYEDISIENIERISSICVLLSVEFNDCCSKSNNIKINRTNQKNNNDSNENNSYIYVNKFQYLNHYLIKEIKNLMYWQIFCLKKINYNLNKYSAFDYINLFFSLGIVFTNDYIDIHSMYLSCVNILKIIQNNFIICKYNQYIIAMSIIYIKFNNSNFFDKNIFKFIYGVNFDKMKYRICINDINNVLNNLFNFNYSESILLNNYTINNNNISPYFYNLFMSIKDGTIINYNNDIKNYKYSLVNYDVQSLLNNSYMKLDNNAKCLNNFQSLNNNNLKYSNYQTNIISENRK